MPYPYPSNPDGSGDPQTTPFGSPAPTSDPFQAGNARLSFHDQLSKILSAGTAMATEKEATENQRYSESLANTRAGAELFDKPSMTDLDTRRMFAEKSDQAGRDFNANIGQLRGALGGAGIVGGGYGAALGAKYEAARQASLTDATLSGYQKRIDTDMMDRLGKWQANQAVSQSIGRDPSMIAMDWLGAAGTLALGEHGIDAQSKSAKKAADAQKKAGLMSGIGGVLGGVF